MGGCLEFYSTPNRPFLSYLLQHVQQLLVSPNYNPCPHYTFPGGGNHNSRKLIGYGIQWPTINAVYWRLERWMSWISGLKSERSSCSAKFWWVFLGFFFLNFAPLNWKSVLNPTKMYSVLLWRSFRQFSSFFCIHFCAACLCKHRLLCYDLYIRVQGI